MIKKTKKNISSGTASKTNIKNKEQAKQKESKKHNTQWGGRFQGSASQVSERISESISFDYKLFRHDIFASTVHAKMLERQKIISTSQKNKIVKGLKQIEQEIAQGKMHYDFSLEDIHTHVEKRLIEIIGQDGKRLHTGRSRNDQVSVDVYLYLKENIIEQKKILKSFLSLILEKAKQYQKEIWAGYTHTQIAQPVLLSHYLLSWFWAFLRDYNLLNFALQESSVSVLGSAALAGAGYPIDREWTAKELGFAKVSPNSMDAVANRDYQLAYHFFASRFFVHVSRFCEDVILYNTAEFSYVTLSDAVTTGSSIMPQKKNPDIAELLRGKSARVSGNLQALLMNLKSLPLTYNRDLQEDKLYLFDSVEQVYMGIEGMQEIWNNIQYHPKRVEENLNKGFAQATDIADYLVSKYNVPFREAHEITGSMVMYCEQNKKNLKELNDNELDMLLKGKYQLDKDVLSLHGCIERKQGTGSTSSAQVQKQWEQAQKQLQELD